MNGNPKLTTPACGLFAVLALASATSATAAKAIQAENANPAAVAHSEIGPRCQGQAARPAQLALQVGKSSLMHLPDPVQHRSVGNPAVVQALLVAPDTLYIAGVDVGTTNMIVQGKSGMCSMVEITVAIDPAPLQATLAAVMPEEREIKVLAAADTLVLSGIVSDATAVARAAELANAYVRRPLRALTATDKEKGLAADEVGVATAGIGAGASIRVINMLAVSAPQQVQLEVKVAEVSKTLLERLDASATWRFGSGSWGATLLSNFISSAAKGTLQASKANGNSLRLDAEKQDSLVRMLAEPNVTALSGQEGSFLAGGKFYIPVAQENNRITLAEKEFGVGLRFTPTVLAGGRVNLQLASEVSELSREGVGISTTGSNGTAVLPVVTTRRSSTTVQLYDGQSFAIGGLVKNNSVSSLNGLPVLGEVPVLGALFRSTNYQRDRTELVFVITVHLVKPMPGSGYTLPTDKVGEPSRAAVLLGGRLDGAAPKTTTAAASNPALAVPPSQRASGFELK